MKFSDLKVYHILLILALIGLIVAFIILIKDEDEDVEVNFVAAVSNENKMIYSENGIDWKESSNTDLILKNRTLKLSYAEDLNSKPIWFVGTSASGGVNKSIAYSNDGKNWKYVTGSNFSSYCVSVGYGLSSNKTNKMWVAVGQGGTCAGNIMWSNDTQNWNNSESYGASFSEKGHDVAYGTSNGVSPLWVAVGEDSTGGSKNILYSEDGKKWHQSDSTGASFSQFGLTVAYGLSSNGQPLWIAGGRDDSDNFRNVLYSNNGKKWFASNGGTSFNPNCNGFTFGKTNIGTCLFVGVGRQRDQLNSFHTILKTSNGRTLERTFGASFYDPGDGDSERGYGITYKNFGGNKGRWVAVGDPGTHRDQTVNNSAILYSDNGTSWKNSNYSIKKTVYGVASNTLLYSMNQGLI